MKKAEFIESITRGHIDSWYMDFVSVPIINTFLSDSEDVLSEFRTMEQLGDDTYFQESILVTSKRLIYVSIKKDKVSLESLPVDVVKKLEIHYDLIPGLGTHKGVAESCTVTLEDSINNKKMLEFTVKDDPHMLKVTQQTNLESIIKAFSDVQSKTLGDS
jgi:hypothetical protein